MAAAIGGRLTRMQATTIPTRRHTAAGIIMLDMVIIMARRITIQPPGPMDGKGLLLAPTVRRHGLLGTILTLGLTPGAVRCLRRMELAVPHKAIIRTPARTLKRDRTRARQLSGAVLTFPAATRALLWATIRARMER